MSTGITARDKKLLYMLGLIVIAALFFIIGIRPLNRKITALDERIDDAQVLHDSIKMKIFQLDMIEEFKENSEKWLEKNGFTPDGKTYIYAGNDSYNIKEELKQAGFRFDSMLLWHKATKDEKYIDRLIEINFDDILEMSAWGTGHYKEGAKEYITNRIAEVQPEDTSEWVGEVGEKIKDIKIQLTRKYSFETKYGYSTCFNFIDENGNVLVWFSSTVQECEIGQWVSLKYGTVKEHNEYKSQKQTILTRCKLVY